MREIPRAATKTALNLATPPREIVTNGRRDAVWRLREDGIVELARANWGRVELLEVFGDGSNQIVATSGRSLRKVVAHQLFFVTGALLVLTVAGTFAGIHAAWALGPVVFVAFASMFILGAGSSVRAFVRSRYGSDTEWVDVPWAIEGEPTTANQTIALTRVPGIRFRVADDGSLEAVVRGKVVDVLRIERDGTVVAVEQIPKKLFKRDLDGWHKVVARDPTD